MKNQKYLIYYDKKLIFLSFSFQFKTKSLLIIKIKKRNYARIDRLPISRMQRR